MAAFTVPRLVPKTNRAGLTRWYWQPSKSLRAAGHRPQALGSTETPVPTPDIVAACQALNEEADKASRPTGPAPAPGRPLPLTLGAAIRRYKDAGYPSVKRPGEKVSDRTAKEYEHKLRKLDRWGGDVLLSSITPERVDRLRDGLMQPARSGRREGEVRHHDAHETLRVGRSFFTWCEQQRMIPRGSNPFTGFALATPAPRDAIWWAPERELLLEIASDHDAGMAVAIDLAFSIGQREADLLKLTIRQFEVIPPYKLDPDVWEQLAEHDPATGTRNVKGIRIRQSKGGRWIEVPVVGETRQRLEAQIARAKAAKVTTILFDQRTDRPWTQPSLRAGQDRFQVRFAALRKMTVARAKAEQMTNGEDLLEATIARLEFRDFRRTAVVYLGELGLPDHLIAAITGHDLDETKKILDTYMPRTTGMAARAIALSRARSAPTAKEKTA